MNAYYGSTTRDSEFCVGYRIANFEKRASRLELWSLTMLDHSMSARL